ncbi:MAG: hypothetical protein EOP83_14370 [Verrucomicrobiaceae bacterium]|nr:MAG: hypothetical protein EOP83_14370 [Verrucomicrobiaceae bacterium]
MSLKIGPDMFALAEQGYLGPDDYAGLPATSEIEQAAIQRLIDYNMRGLLLSPSTASARRTALSAARLTQPSSVIVSTTSPRHWFESAAEFGFSASANPQEQTDCLIISPTILLGQATLAHRRDGVLLIDHQDGYMNSEFDLYAASMAGPAREVRKTVLIYNFASLLAAFHGWSRQCDISLQGALKDLWPEASLEVLRQTPTVVGALKARGFRKCRSADLYFMFNVVTDLLGDKQPQ